MSSPVTVMLVDDNDSLRSALNRRLTHYGYRVADFASGNEAIDFVTTGTQTIPYAFIDYVLDATPSNGGQKRPLDGIETTRQLMRADPSICVVVFSGQPNISPTQRQRAREAGARGFIYKQHGIQIERDIVEFMRELDAFREMRSLVEEVQQQRQRLAATLREVPVGTLLIDKALSPWVANQEWREIEEKLDPLEFPVHRLADSLLEDQFRMDLVEAAFRGEETDGLSLCVMGKEKLKYLHTRARPVRNKQSQVVACALTVVDETPYDTVREMPLQRRASLIVEAILRAGYDRARFYRVSGDGTRLMGVVEAGGGVNVEPFEDYPIEFNKAKHLRKTLEGRLPCFWRIANAEDITEKELGKSSDFVVFPLFHQDRLTGWLTIDREYSHQERPMSEDDIEPICPYAAEALKALLEAPEQAAEAGEIGEGLADVWSKIERCKDPDEAMQVVLEAALHLTCSIAAIIRVREGHEAVMVAGIGDFPRHRPKRIPIEGKFWSVRAILRRQPIIVQDKNSLPPGFMDEMETWSERARQAYDHVAGFAAFPLTFGETFGALTAYASDVNHFTPRRRRLLLSLAHLAAMAWIDLTRIRDRQAAAKEELAFATVHNLRQPTMALRGALRRILKKGDRGTLTIPGAVSAVQDALKYLQRSEDIITDVLRYLKPLDFRKSVFKLDEFVQSIIHEFAQTQEDIEVLLDSDPQLDVCVDRESLRQALEELLTNAVNAMAGQGTIKVRASSTPQLDAQPVYLSGVSIEIEDDGLGIAPQMEGRLFEPFTTTAATGTGLGLAFVKNVVDEHNGRIWHEAVEPHGTRFIMVLPRDLKEDNND